MTEAEEAEEAKMKRRVAIINATGLSVKEYEGRLAYMLMTMRSCADRENLGWLGVTPEMRPVAVYLNARDCRILLFELASRLHQSSSGS